MFTIRSQIILEARTKVRIIDMFPGEIKLNQVKGKKSFFIMTGA
jgi:hypothetical protein